MTCSVWFRIQRIIKKYPGYYSAYGSKFQGIIQNTTCSAWSIIQGIIQNTTCCVWFIIIIKNVQGIIQRLIHDSGYYSKYDLQRLVQDSAYYSKMSRILFSVWFSIQGIIQNTTCSVWFSIQGIIQNTTCRFWFRIQRIIKNWPGYYSASGSVFSVLFGVLFKI